MEPTINNTENEGRRLLSGWRLFGLAAVLCAVSLGAMIYTLHKINTSEAEFVPPSFETAAQAGSPDVPEDLGWEELDAEAFRFSVCGEFIPTDGQADVWLTNPENSEVWLKLRVLDKDGKILGQTGLLRPGEYVRSVTLDVMPEDGDPIILKVMAYEPDTYYSAGVVSLNTTVKGDAP